MKKSFFLIFLTMSLCLLLTSCNGAARKWGGTTTIDLPEGRKLMNVTWKDSDLWYLTREMNDKDVAETYRFDEDSNWGVVEGTVIIKEHK